MIAPREREADAIATLVTLHLDGPDEWGPEHYDTAEAAARVAAEWVRRAKIGQVQPAPARTSRPISRPKGDSPAFRSGKVQVRLRSHGFCEARGPECEGQQTQTHHIGGRGWEGCDLPVMLLAVCGQGNVSGCHGTIHQHRPWAERHGFLTPSGVMGRHPTLLAPGCPLDCDIDHQPAHALPVAP